MRLRLAVSWQSSVVSRKKQRTTDHGRRTQCLKLVFRHLSPALLAACCLLSITYRLHAASGRYEVREVKPRVFVWIPEDILDQDGDPQFSRAGTAGFILTRDAVVVVDTTNSPFHARELLYEIRRRTELPIQYVINTDSRGDYVLGNEVFAEQQATILSATGAQAEIGRYQQDLARRLEGDWRLQSRLRGFHVTLPNQTYDPEMSLRVAGEEIKLSILGHSGSANTAVYLPRVKVLFLGDLFESQYFPRIGSRDVRRWIEILRHVETWDVDTYVPGHGLPGHKKELTEFRQFLEWLSSEVETRIRQGQSLAQVKSELVPFERYPWRARELAPEAVEAVYRQLAGAPRPSSPAADAGPSRVKSPVP